MGRKNLWQSRAKTDQLEKAKLENAKNIFVALILNRIARATIVIWSQFCYEKGKKVIFRLQLGVPF